MMLSETSVYPKWPERWGFNQSFSMEAVQRGSMCKISNTLPCDEFSPENALFSL